LVDQIGALLATGGLSFTMLSLRLGRPAPVFDSEPSAPQQRRAARSGRSTL